MARITVNTKIDGVLSRLDGFGATMDRAIVEDVSRTAYDIQIEAKRRAAVRTGWMRDHIDVRIEDNGRGAVVFVSASEVPYARFQKKFLQPAARSERNKLLERLSERLAGAAEG